MAITIHRRRVLKILASSGVLAGFSVHGQEDDAPVADLAVGSPRKTATDPNLFDPHYHDSWEAFLTEDELAAARVLCDVILPADDISPAASAVGVPEFIAEWTRAPYPSNQRDAALVREGLAWFDGELKSAHGTSLATATEAQCTELCDRVADAAKAAAGDKKGAQFFRRFRQLVMGGFYTTPEGRADLGYIGNLPMAVYPGASDEALKHLGLV